MVAYWVNSFRDEPDGDNLARYAEAAGPVMRAHGGRFLARGLPAAVFEDGLPLRTVVIEFPSVADAEAAYRSEAYQAALTWLEGEAPRDIRVIEGA